MKEAEAYTLHPSIKKDGWDTVFEWLALAAMVLQPPVRGNWGKMKCTTDWEVATTLHTNTSLNENFLYQKPNPNGEQFGSREYGDRESRYVMCINVDKVSKKTGSDQIVCSQEFSDCLTTSFKMWPRAYAFPKKYDGQSRQVNSTKPMGDREMPGFLSKIKDQKWVLRTMGRLCIRVYSCCEAATSRGSTTAALSMVTMVRFRITMRRRLWLRA